MPYHRYTVIYKSILQRNPSNKSLSYILIHPHTSEMQTSTILTTLLLALAVTGLPAPVPAPEPIAEPSPYGVDHHVGGLALPVHPLGIHPLGIHPGKLVLKEKLLVPEIKVKEKLLGLPVLKVKQSLYGTCLETGKKCKAVGHQDCPAGTYYRAAQGTCIKGKEDHLDCREGFRYSHAENKCVQKRKRGLEDGAEGVDGAGA
jgi:hypothetical protein